MFARDVMSRIPITVTAETSVEACARLLLDKRISAVPVVDPQQHVIGIVSEGDLMRRRESGTERRASWWLSLVSDPRSAAREYTKSAGHSVGDIMTRQVISVREDTGLAAIADILEKHRIKRVPVLNAGKLVGIVSRADLVRAMVRNGRPADAAVSDADIRKTFFEWLEKEPWGARSFVNLVVEAGRVELWGVAESADETRAIGVLAQGIPGVREVANHVRVGDHSKYLF